MYGDPKTLGGKYIAVGERINSTYYLSTEGSIAGNTFTVHKGTNRIQARIITPTPDDLFCMSIPGVTTQRVNHIGDRVMLNDIEAGSYWHWDCFHKYKKQDCGARCSAVF